MKIKNIIHVSKEDFAKYILDESIPWDEVRSTIYEQFEIPRHPEDSTVSPNDFLDYVYDEFLKRIIALDIYEKEIIEEIKKSTVPSNNLRGAKTGYILNVVKENKKIEFKALEKMVEEEFNYGDKKARSRIRTALKELTSKGALYSYYDDDIKDIIIFYKNKEVTL